MKKSIDWIVIFFLFKTTKLSEKEKNNILDVLALISEDILNQSKYKP